MANKGIYLNMDIKKIRRKEGIPVRAIKKSRSCTTSCTTGERDLLGRFAYQIMPDNGWFILSQFAKSKYSFSVKELHLLFRGGIHFNTVKSMICRLKEKAWIVCYTNESGRTRTEKRYKITLDGLAVWNIYKDK